MERSRRTLLGKSRAIVLNGNNRVLIAVGDLNTRQQCARPGPFRAREYS